MKKITKHLLLIIVIFVVSFVNVDAKTYSPQDIEPNSYVIGTHVFTSDTELTMQKIMYASQSIQGDINDMIIYYKDPWGDWYDAISEEQLYIGKKFNVEYVDLDVLPPTPEIEAYAYDEEEKFQDKTVIVDFYIDGEYGICDEYGIEIYKSEEKDGNYSLIEKIDEESCLGYIETEIESGMQYYYAARTFKEIDGVLYYSDYSNIEKINNIEVAIIDSITEIDEEDNLFGSYKIKASKGIDGIRYNEYIYDLEGNLLYDYNDIMDFTKLSTYSSWLYKNECVVVKAEPYKVVNDVKVYYDSIALLEECNEGLTLTVKSVNIVDENAIYNIDINSRGTGNKIYYREFGSNDEFKLLKETLADNVDIEIPIGKTYEVKATASNKNGSSSFSNTIICYSELPKPTGEIVEIDYEDYLKIELPFYVDGIEVYTSDVKNSSYKLAGAVYTEYFDQYEDYGFIIKEANSVFILIDGLENYSYMKIRFVLKSGQEEKYSDFSDIIEKPKDEEFEYYYNYTDINNNSIFDIYTYTDSQGVEVYYSEEDVEDSYKLLDTVNLYGDPYLSIPQGKSYYVKVRTFDVFDTGKVYNEFLPTQLIENEYSIILEESFDSYLNGVYSYDLNIGFNSYDAYFDYSSKIGMEVYCSSKIDGEYSMIADEYDAYTTSIEIPEGEERYCYAKLYEKESDKKQYGITTNTVTIKPIVYDTLNIDSVDIWETDAIVQILLKDDDLGQLDGMELYTSSTKDGEYKAVSTIEEFEFNDLYLNFDIKFEDINKFYKVRKYIYNGDKKIYSQYSNAVEFKFDKIKLDITPIGCASDTLCEAAFEVKNFDENSNVNLGFKNISVYVKETDSDEFKLLEIVKDGTYFVVDYNPNLKNAYKVRMYVGPEENRIYSDWSNEVSFTFSPVEIELEEPILKVDYLGEDNNGSYLYDLFINYKDYYIYDDGEVTISQIDGWELYLADVSEGKESVEIDGTNYTMVADHTGFGVVPREYVLGSGKTYKYIARVYSHKGETKIYSDWSEMLIINEEILQKRKQPNQLISFEELETKLENKETFMLEIVQTGCSHCDSFTTKFNKILTEYYLKAVTINISDLTVEENKKLNDLYNIYGTPMVVFVKSGEEDTNVNRIVGDISENSIISKLVAAGYIE